MPDKDGQPDDVVHPRESARQMQRHTALAPIPEDIAYAMRVFPAGNGSLRIAFVINIENHKFDVISINGEGSELVFTISPA